MAALAILASIGVFCWLLYGAAIYALPFLVGAFVGLNAERVGAGALGGIVLGVSAGMLLLIVGRAAFAQARGPVLRVAIALAFAGPAALAGYAATSMLFGLDSASEGWREAFAIIGAIAPSPGNGLPQRYRRPATTFSTTRRRRRRGGMAHSTARWIRAADLSGGRCEFERHRLDTDDREVRATLAGSPRARKLSLSFKVDGDAFCLSPSSSAEHSRPTQDVTSAVASVLMAAVRYSPGLLGNSLFREARPFTSTMA